MAAGLAIIVFLLFREAPELGDDLDYWALARDLHDNVASAWSARSFHDLRWPVWGPIWLAQAVGCPGLVAYCAAPLLYFTGTAVVVFLLARSCRCDRWLAFAAVVLYALHPYQDTVFSRPMPDLSEGFWIGAAVLCWVRGRGNFPVLGLGGLCLALAISNRITGAFGAVALGLAALLCERDRWRELFALAGAAVAAMLVEWTLWAAVTGDFLAVIHANLGGRGRAGTGPISPLELPFRFLRYLGGGGWQVLLSALLVLGVLGSWRDRTLRVICVAALVWWVAISCAVQGFDPVRPMLRTSGRFLAGLSPLLAVIGAGGLSAMLALAPRGIRTGAGIAALAAICLAGGLLHKRSILRETFPEEIAKIVESTPPGRQVMADSTTRHLAMLCAEAAARKIDWDVQKQMVISTPELEKAVMNVDEIWFFRSKIWNWVLVDLRSGKLRRIPRLASYLEPPFTAFWPRAVILHEQIPEFQFLARSSGRREVVPIGIPGLPGFPVAIDRNSFPKGKWNGPAIPIASDGDRIAAVHFRASSPGTEPFMAWIEFLRAGKIVTRLEFEPPGFPESSPDTYFFEIPADCDAWRPRLQVREKMQVDRLEEWR